MQNQILKHFHRKLIKFKILNLFLLYNHKISHTIHSSSKQGIPYNGRLSETKKWEWVTGYWIVYFKTV